MKTAALVIPALTLLLVDTVLGQVTRTWNGSTDNNFLTTSNWTPNGLPASTDTIIIPQTTNDPVLSGAATVYSIHLQDTFSVTSTGAVTTSGNFSVADSGRLTITSSGTFTIGGKLSIDSGGVVEINSAVTISQIADDVVLNGSLLIDNAVAATITCSGDWLRGSSSSFSPGNSLITFTNPVGTINIHGSTFYDLVIGTALADTFSGNVTINNRLILADSVVMHDGDTLTIVSSDTAALRDSTGTSLINRGVIRRAIHSSSTSHYHFHHTDVSVKFQPTGSRPSFVNVAEFPDSNLNQVGGGGYDVKRFYGIDAVGGSGFLVELTLRYLQSEVYPGVDESQLGPWRTEDNGLSWVFVGGTVDTIENFITADSVTQFSKWSQGTPNGPLPITLSSFTVQLNPGGEGVLLEWATHTEINNYGFYVERRYDHEVNFTTVSSLIPGAGTTNEPQYYSYVDATLTQTGLYHYRLRQQDLNGSFHYSWVESIDVVTLNARTVEMTNNFRLSQNYPNPFNPSTVIRFRVENSGFVTLKVFNVLGQNVALLVHENMQPGEYEVVWDASKLPGGVYYYRLTTLSGSMVRKAVVLK